MHPNHEGLPLFSTPYGTNGSVVSSEFVRHNKLCKATSWWKEDHSYAVEDASEAWYTFHPNKENVTKFMASIVVGRVREEKDSTLTEEKVKEMALLEDFHQICDIAEKSGFFESNAIFYTFIMAHILFFDFLGWWTLATYGTGWLPFFVATFFLIISQVQSGWSMHDYGHLSVFENRRLNHCSQTFLLTVMKGSSTQWWNFRHNNHHAKPNVLNMDLDVSLAPVLLVGETVPKEYGTWRNKDFPYISQHKYFFFIIPPFLIPIYFTLEILYFIFKRKLWQELFWMTLFILRWQLMFTPILGLWGFVGLYLNVRFFESHWFFWATQMSHIPMYIDYDQKGDWVSSSQIKASCNVKNTWFNAWWSGHLNLQIERHLFPTMPRHNLSKVAPLVKSMCEKHNLVYRDNLVLTAFGDIVRSLKTSGQIWQEAYNNS